MNTKQRDVVFQRWSGAIRRETRDLVSLDQIGARALADSDVRDDPTLQSMIQAEVQNRRAQLEQDLKDEESAAAQAEPRITSRSEPPEPIPTTTPERDREILKELVQALSTALERGDEDETGAILRKMRSLQEQRPGLLTAGTIAEYERQADKLRARVRQLRDEITVVTQQAVSAAHNGSEQDLVRSMSRLTAIHAAHPRLLDESGLEDVRHDVADAANERRQHQLTTKRVLERERAITAEIETLAAAVREFHQVAFTVPDTSEEFRKAEAKYLQTIKKVRTYDTEWFSGVVLDLADLLADWTVPPPKAEGQIDRFLDSISTGLDSIRAEMREIEDEQDSGKGNGSDPAVPGP